MRKTVEFNSKSENPFYGMSNTLRMYQNASKGNKSFDLDACWKECKTKEQKALFFAICMSVGDVTARQHNMFRGKVDNGGYAERILFRDTILPFLWKKANLKTSAIDPIDFLCTVVEYTVLDNILATRVQTQKGKKTILNVIDQVSIFGIDNVVKVCKRLLHGTAFQKTCLAKFMVLPQSRKNMHPETAALAVQRKELLKAFSDECNFPYTEEEGYFNPVGYKTWRKQFNQNFDSVLFSTKAILAYDEEQFKTFLNGCPSDARHRVKCRIMDHNNECKKDIYSDLCKWFLEWDKYKDAAQETQRVLEEKVRQGAATSQDIKDLKKAKKAAKVNVGAVNINKLFEDVILRRVEKVKVQPFLDKIKMEYDALVMFDDSGSMASDWGGNPYPYTPRQMAAFIATICLLKNPDDEARSLIASFSNQCKWFGEITKQKSRTNRFTTGIAKAVKQPLLDPEKHFLDNYKAMQKFMDAISTGNGTNVASIANSISAWMSQDEQACIDALSVYPLWILISDGNFNNGRNVQQSLAQAFKIMENKCGFKPYVLLIDVAHGSSADIREFDGLDNVMMVPPNIANLETIFTNFKDIDTYDVYTPLLTLSRSSRYQPIRALWKIESDNYSAQVTSETKVKV